MYAPQPALAVGVATGALAFAVLPMAVLAGFAGRRRLILISVSVSVAIGLLLPLAQSYPALLVMRGLQGVAIAGMAGTGAAYLTDRLGRAGAAAAIGAMIAGNTLVGMSGRLLTGFSVDAVGWRGAFAVVSLVFLPYAMGALSSATAGLLVGRVGRRRALISALLITAAGSILTIPDALPVVVAGFAVLTIGFFAAHAVAHGWTAAAAPREARGHASGHLHDVVLPRQQRGRHRR